MNPRETDTQVLIVGAGPTGLVLAIVLADLGVNVRIVDKAPQPGTTSRALVVHARTLEFYRQLGFADRAVEGGVNFVAANLWVKGRPVGRVQFGNLGETLSTFPFMLIFPQDRHEALLIEELAARGVQVERPTEAVSVQSGENEVHTLLRHADGTQERCRSQFIAGCDGAHSVVRELSGVTLEGGTYAHLFYVADVIADGPVANDELHVSVDEADLLAIFPLRGQGRARLVGTVRPPAGDSHALATWDDVSTRLISQMRTNIREVNWFSTYHVHHRVASAFRRGRAFLLGDAAHLHSPVGGQGMNTGIGDAVNLAWKLAAALHSPQKSALLDTYEPERIAFARGLVATTDRVFEVANSDGPTARFVRTRIVPMLMPPLMQLTGVRRFMFRLMSQIAIRYRASALSSGRAGEVHAGDRIPWIAGIDNFATLNGMRWQAHVYGSASAGLEAYCKTVNVPLQVFAWQDTMRDAGLERDAVYLLRPDGYVGYAGAASDMQGLQDYAARWIA